MDFARLELRRQVLTSSTSMLSRLVKTTSLRLAGVPSADELSKAQYSQKNKEKNEGTFENMGFSKKPFQDFTQKEFDTLLV